MTETLTNHIFSLRIRRSSSVIVPSTASTFQDQDTDLQQAQS